MRTSTTVLLYKTRSNSKQQKHLAALFLTSLAPLTSITSTVVLPTVASSIYYRFSYQETSIAHDHGWWRAARTPELPMITAMAAARCTTHSTVGLRATALHQQVNQHQGRMKYSAHRAPGVASYSSSARRPRPLSATVVLVVLPVLVLRGSTLFEVVVVVVVGVVVVVVVVVL